MAGRGPAPKTTRRNKADVPIRGEWRPAPGVGWQHEPFPAPPDGLLAASRNAWDTWLHSWVAAHWTPDDVPALRQLVRLYDEVERGEMQRASELRLWMDTMGVTPKGQQDRRWTRPETHPAAGEPQAPNPYAHLKVVGS